MLRGEPGAPAVAVVTGDAGMGKTRLVTEVVHATPEVQVLSGACLPLSVSLPYGAITDAFAGLASSSGRPALDSALARCASYVRPQMAALIPALSDEPRGSPDSSADRTRLFAAVRDLLAALGTERRIALVVEDLHWADPGTLDLFTALVQGHSPAGTALVVTSRRDELPADDPVLDWLASTVRVPGVEHLVLTSLSDDDVGTLIASMVDAEPTAPFVAEVLRRSEGNPFFTEQLVAAAHDAAPPLEVPAGVPREVAQMLLARIRSVSANAAEVAAVLAVAARPLTEPELTVCAGTDVGVVAGLRELLDAHLVETTEDDGYRLRHALLEDTVRATLLGSQRAALHAGVAAVLAARASEAPGEVAAHWGRAGRRVEEARWSAAAARHAEGLFAWREASASWRRVWELWSSLQDDEQPDVDLPEAVVGCVHNAALVDLASDRADPFLDLAREALADERVSGDDYATGKLLYEYGTRLHLIDRPAGLSALEQAVARFEGAGRPSAEHALAISRLATSRRSTSATTGNEDDELARAADIAEQGGHLNAALELTGNRVEDLLESGHVEKALAVLEQAQQRAIDRDAGPGHLAVAVAATDSYLWLLRLSDGVAAGRAGITRALRDGQGESFDFYVLVANTVQCLRLLGETEDAAALVDEYRMPEVTVMGWPLQLDRAELDLLSGDLTAAMLPVERLEDLQYNEEELWLWLAEIGAAAHLWSGRTQPAHDRVDRGMAQIESSPVAVRASRMLAFGAWAAADLADADPTLDRERSAERLQAWTDKAECFGAHPGRVLGAGYGATFEAELARLRRNGQQQAWRAAKDIWAGHLVPHHAAYAGWRLAECLLDAGHRKAAQEELAVAYTAAKGHVPLRSAIEGLARRARLDLPTGTDVDSHLSDDVGDLAPHGLTSRELDVLRLLGTGATNAEIGRRLYMSPKTASVHVSAIIRKLGVTGRVQAATVAERMGLLVDKTGPAGDACSSATPARTIRPHLSRAKSWIKGRPPRAIAPSGLL